MASSIIQLPAGTGVKKCINLPTTGSWLGGVTVSLAVTNADATILDWLYIWPDATVIGTHYYRRVGGTVGGSFKNWTLSADSRIYRPLYAHETITTVHYTSTNDISLCVETTRSTVFPFPHPQTTGVLPNNNGQMFYQSTPPT